MCCCLGDLGRGLRRYFKLYALLWQHQLGIAKYTRYVCARVGKVCEAALHQAFQSAGTTRASHIDTLANVYETVAKAITDREPGVETYYGERLARVGGTYLPRLLLKCDSRSTDFKLQYIYTSNMMLA